MTIFTPRPQWIVDLINELAGTGRGTWGAISGTLSNQTDLQAALNAKVDDSQISAFGGTLIDDADAAAARTTLGLGSASTLSTSDIDERARDAVGTALVAGSNITITPNDGSDTITIAATGGVASGTSFPGSPSTNDRFYRTDRRIEYFYDGTRWLSTALYSATLDGNGTAVVTATTQMGCPHPHYNDYAIYIEKLKLATYSTTTTASNYFVAQLRSIDAGVVTSRGASQSFQGATQAQWVAFSVTVNEVIPSTVDNMDLLLTETGTSQTIIGASFTYRIVG